MLGRWDPFAELSRLQDEVFRGGDARRRRDERALAYQPAVDIWEGKDGIVVKAELPGVKPEEVDISVENHILTIHGERKFEKEENTDGYHRIESTYGAFSRSFTLPNTVATDGIEASLTNGVLTVKLPKRAEAQPRKISVGGAKPTAAPKVEAKENRPSVS